jgi:hypothetical protein
MVVARSTSPAATNRCVKEHAISLFIEAHARKRHDAARLRVFGIEGLPAIVLFRLKRPPCSASDSQDYGRTVGIDFESGPRSLLRSRESLNTPISRSCPKARVSCSLTLVAQSSGFSAKHEYCTVVPEKTSRFAFGPSPGWAVRQFTTAA